MTRRRIYVSSVEAALARAEQNRNWHMPFRADRIPWRVIVDGEIVALFMQERDARGFAKARYGSDAIVELRASGPIRRRPFGQRDNEPTEQPVDVRGTAVEGRYPA